MACPSCGCKVCYQFDDHAEEDEDFFTQPEMNDGESECATGR